MRVSKIFRLDAAVEAAVYRVVQEALTTAHRHGNGQTSVVLKETQHSMVLTITDPASTRRNREGSAQVVSYLYSPPGKYPTSYPPGASG